MSDLAPNTRQASGTPTLGTGPAKDAVPGTVPAPSAGDGPADRSVPPVSTGDASAAESVPASGSVPTAVPASRCVPAVVPGPVLTFVPAPVAVPGSGAAAHAEGPPGSVWLTGQQPSRTLRRGRYTHESLAHPGKMLPTIARYAINTYTEPGDLVLDPMAGIGTTVIEAMHLNRHGIGVEYEQRWAALAAVNIALAAKQAAPGTGQIYTGDSRQLPSLLPPQIHGRVALVITSPPYGPSTHGHVRTPGARRGKVRKLNHRYGGADNLAYRDHDTLAQGFTDILTGCRAVLRPGGHVVITARPYRRHGELIDITGMVVAAGQAAGLELVEECIALIAGVRDGVLVPRASFFQQKNVRDAIAAGDPQWLQQHEDVIILRYLPCDDRRDLAHGGCVGAATHTSHTLDASTPTGVDQRAHRAHPRDAITSGNSATNPRPRAGRDKEGKPDPCPPYSRPLAMPYTNSDQWPIEPVEPHPNAGSPGTAGG